MCWSPEVYSLLPPQSLIVLCTYTEHSSQRMAALRLIHHVHVCASPLFAVLVPDAGPVSGFLINITATVASWIAAYLTAVWIASDTAI